MAYGNLGGLYSQVGDIISLHFISVGRGQDASLIRLANHSLWLSYNGDFLDNAIETFELVPSRHKTIYVQTNHVGSFEIENFNWDIYQRGCKAVFNVHHSENLMLSHPAETNYFDQNVGDKDDIDYEIPPLWSPRNSPNIHHPDTEDGKFEILFRIVCYSLL